VRLCRAPSLCGGPALSARAARADADTRRRRARRRPIRARAHGDVRQGHSIGSTRGGESGLGLAVADREFVAVRRQPDLRRWLGCFYVCLPLLNTCIALYDHFSVGEWSSSPNYKATVKATKMSNLAGRLLARDMWHDAITQPTCFCVPRIQA
jgi:hypothetical protein